MRFIKIQRDAAYTIVPNAIIESDEMNLKDVGLLCFLLHLPDDWDFSIEGLVAILRHNGRSSVMSGLNRLEELGYLARWRERVSGQLRDAIWIVSDAKMSEADIQGIASKYTTTPMSEKPTSENPTLENRRQINKKVINKKESIKKEKYKKERKAEETDDFDAFWQAYPKKVGKQAARRAFEKVKDVPLQTILNAIEQQKKMKQWQDNNGQFIPHPSTWLNRGSWDDELPGMSNKEESVASAQKEKKYVQETDEFGNTVMKVVDANG